MSEEVIKKLANIFANQNKILQKLAADLLEEPVESDMREAQRTLTDAPQEMGSHEDKS